MAEMYEKVDRHDEAAKLKEELAGLDAVDPAAAGISPVPASTASPDTHDQIAAPAAAPPPTAGKNLPSLEQALEAVRAAKGPEAPETIKAMTALAAAHGADGSGRKAIKLAEAALDLARRVLPTGDTHTLEAMKTLIPLYRSVDLEAEAAALEQQLKSAAQSGPSTQKE
jgi:hypothetical protein